MISKEKYHELLIWADEEGGIFSLLYHGIDEKDFSKDDEEMANVLLKINEAQELWDGFQKGRSKLYGDPGIKCNCETCRDSRDEWME